MHFDSPASPVGSSWVSWRSLDPAVVAELQAPPLGVANYYLSRLGMLCALLRKGNGGQI